MCGEVWTTHCRSLRLPGVGALLGVGVDLVCSLLRRGQLQTRARVKSLRTGTLRSSLRWLLAGENGPALEGARCEGVRLRGPSCSKRDAGGVVSAPSRLIVSTQFKTDDRLVSCCTRRRWCSPFSLGPAGSVSTEVSCQCGGRTWSAGPHEERLPDFAGLVHSRHIAGVRIVQRTGGFLVVSWRSLGL